ncbi:MAG TPA: universal stress protein [Candidatus Eisenbacteria bacterium]|nr:universal stress protein [Candidatus Eisenbacteria bacterium]
MAAELQLLRPPLAPASGIRRILLATDLSPASDGAAIQATALAHDLGAELLVVSVIDASSVRPVGLANRRPDQVRASRETSAQDLVSRGRAAGVRVTFLIWDGDPGQSIVDAAASEEADLVVVGSHGRGSLGRFFIGSVSDFVVRNARSPVLVVRNQPLA